MAGKRDRLLADAFHQATVAGQHIGVVVDEVAAELVSQLALGDRHADGVRQTLAEWTGGGLDAGGMPELRVAGGLGAELAEIPDLLHRHVFVAEQVKQRVKQHRTVSGRQHEPVAVRPAGMHRIELHEAGEQHRDDVGGAHRQAGMAGICRLYGIHGKKSDRVRHPVVFFARCHDLS